MTYSADVLVIAGLARNCERFVPNLRAALDRLNAVAVIGENGSVDSTRTALNGDPRIRLVDTSSMAHISQRLPRLAHGRELVAAAIPDDAGYVAVVDLDGPFVDGLQTASVDAATARLDQQEVFAVSATSFPTYYDLLAFDCGDGRWNDLAERISAAQHNPVRYWKLFHDEIWPAQSQLTRTSDIGCLSAFNGIAIYRTDIYRRGSYATVSECEHLAFNRRLAASTGLRMTIVAELTVKAPSEHQRQNLAAFLVLRAGKAVMRAVPSRSA